MIFKIKITNEDKKEFLEYENMLTGVIKYFLLHFWTDCLYYVVAWF